MSRKIRMKARNAIIQSLKAGVTPKIGIQHIQVGRKKEIEAMTSDINRIVEGEATFRLIVGEYGSGKTFFLNVTRSIALEKNLVTIHADLSPDHRIFSSTGKARNLYTELIHSISTRNKPNGNALRNIIEKFITQVRIEADNKNENETEILKKRLSSLSEFVGGYDFAKVIETYRLGFESGDDALIENSLRWLRAEYTSKLDAKKDLGIRTIISDRSIYDYLKIMSLFVRQAGYNGLLVNLDEMVNLYKLSNSQARKSNYEQLLRILNDCLQGSAGYIGFLLGGTPEFLYNTRKGLFSYEALRSRLAENSFAKKAGIIDYTSVCLSLANLTPEELFILLKNIRHVYASGEISNYLVSDDELLAFLKHCNDTIGAAYFQTPRNTIKAFIDLLAVLEQKTTLNWNDLIANTAIENGTPNNFSISNLPSETEKKIDELSGFKI